MDLAAVKSFSDFLKLKSMRILLSSSESAIIYTSPIYALLKKWYPLFTNCHEDRLYEPRLFTHDLLFQFRFRPHERGQKGILFLYIVRVIESCIVGSFYSDIRNAVFFSTLTFPEQYKHIRIRFIVVISPRHRTEEDDAEKVISFRLMESSYKFCKCLLHSISQWKSIKRLLQRALRISFQYLLAHLFTG